MTVNQSGIYAIRNNVTGQSYIGSSNCLSRRKHDHFKMLCNGKHYNSHLQRAFDKYGSAAFEFRVLILCEPDERLRYEQVLLDRLHPEYNVARTAHGGSTPEQYTPEVRAKLSAAISKVQTGKKRGPHSESHRRALSQSLMGHPVTDEVLEKLRAGSTGRTHKGNHNYCPTEETRRKISESMKRYRQSQRGEA